MAYLIDSDVMVDFTRGNAKAADYLDSLGDDCLLSAITALELIAGARNQREVTDLDVLISAYEQIPPNEEVARRAYALMMTFARAHGLHALDALIAATAIENGFTLVTKNRKHFHNDRRAGRGSAELLSAGASTRSGWHSPIPTRRSAYCGPCCWRSSSGVSHAPATNGSA